MTLANKLGSFSEEFASAKAAFVERGKATFNEALKEFFDASPKVWCIAWAQYTPYFNDGDACTFSVHDVFAYSDKAKEASIEELAHESDGEAYGLLQKPHDLAASWAASWLEKNPDIRERYQKENARIAAEFGDGGERFMSDFDALTSFISANDELMQDLYGDHVVVQIRRTETGVESVVEEHEHD